MFLVYHFAMCLLYFNEKFTKKNPFPCRTQSLRHEHLASVASLSRTPYLIHRHIVKFLTLIRVGPRSAPGLKNQATRMSQNHPSPAPRYRTKVTYDSSHFLLSR